MRLATGATDVTFRHLLCGRPPGGTGVHRIPGVGGDAFVFRYHVVPLWRLDAHRMRKQLGLEGAPFCAAMRGADEAFVRELADDVRSDRSLAKSLEMAYCQLISGYWI